MKLLDALPAFEADELDVLILANRFRWGEREGAQLLHSEQTL